MDSVDYIQEKYKLIFDQLSYQKAYSRKPIQIVYFSNEYANMIIGEILAKKRDAGLNHHLQSSFNQSTQYLFLFDKKLQIKKVFKKIIQYD